MTISSVTGLAEATRLVDDGRTLQHGSQPGRAVKRLVLPSLVVACLFVTISWIGAIVWSLSALVAMVL